MIILKRYLSKDIPELGEHSILASTKEEAKRILEEEQAQWAAIIRREKQGYAKLDYSTLTLDVDTQHTHTIYQCY